jgi:hypothetical protein
MVYDLGIFKRQRYVPPAASTLVGGTFTATYVNGVAYNTHIFTSSGILTATSAISSLEMLVVAGGGGGGSAGSASQDNRGGGGGAGGLLYSSTLTLASANSYAIIVGAGGGNATNGGNSSFSLLSTSGAASVAFNGSSYLSIASNSTFAFGTGDFTVEAWVNSSVAPGANLPIAQSDALGASTNNKWWFAFAGGGLFFGTHSSGGFSVVTTTAFSAGTWYHVAVTRASGVMRMFINGVSTAFTTSGTPSGYSLSQNGFTVGGMSTPSYWTGYISNLRVVNGLAVYTGNFTVPTTSLTSSQSAGTNIAAINAGPIYSNSFNGSSQYLSIASNAALTLGTSDATIELWIYPNSVSGYQRIVTATIGGFAAGAFVMRFSSGAFFAGDSGGNAISSATLPTINQWNHIAWVGVGGTSQTLYINGVNVGTTTSYNLTTAIQWIGGYYTAGNTEYTNGYISNLRIVKGVAVYTGNFTPPKSPLTITQSAGTNIAAITGAQTSLLTAQDATIIDNSTNALAITNNGTVTTTSTLQPFPVTNLLIAPTTASTVPVDTAGGNSITLNGSPSINTFVGPFNTAYLTSIGGGAGGVGPNAGSAGGSGGGGGAYLNAGNYAGGAGTAGQGNAGGLGGTDSVTYRTGGGGGGAGAVGTAGSAGGAGGVGLAYTLAGSLIYYAGGGGGGGGNGGGLGSGAAANGGSATPNTGGGGSGNGSSTTVGGNGGSGIVIIRYLANQNTVPYDPNFTSNTLLLSNQSTVTSFVTDASTNTASISILGDTRPYTFSPYNHGYYSNYFNGSTDYVYIPHSPALDLTSGDFTIECWAYVTAVANLSFIFGKSGVNGTKVPAYTIQYLTANNAWNFETNNSTGAVTGQTYSFGTGSNVLNTWLHFAATRAGTSIKTYLNGALTSSTIQTTAIVDSGERFVIGSQVNGGAYFSGYISNLRITKGQVLYPPLSPVSVDYLVVAGGGGGGGGDIGTGAASGGGGGGGYLSGSLSLLPGSSYTVVVGGGGSDGAFSSNSGTVPTSGSASSFYGISAVGGGYGGHQGSQGATVADGAVGGSGGGGAASTTLGSGSVGSAGTTGQGNAGGTAVSGSAGGGGGAGAAGSNGATGVGGNGGAGRQWLNGNYYAGGGGGASRGATQGQGGLGGGSTATNSSNTPDATANTGGGGGGVTGGASNSSGNGGSGIVIVRHTDTLSTGSITGGGTTSASIGGYIYYTFTASGTITLATPAGAITFTIPTGPLTVTSSTSLLTSQSSRFIDTGYNTATSTVTSFTLVGTPQISQNTPFLVPGTLTRAPNGYAVSFNGNTDYLSFTGNTNLVFGTGDWTVEFWAYLTSIPTQGTFLDLRGTATAIPGSFNVFNAGGAYPNSFTVYNGTSHVATSGITPVANTWFHFAVSKASGTLRIFINGISYYSGTDSTNWSNGNNSIYIGRGFDAGAFYIPGYISNLRIVKGTAVYPPVATTGSTAVQYLVAGGGGGGGQDNRGNRGAGGGGAGGLIISSDTLTYGTVYPIVVGAGGAGGSGSTSVTVPGTTGNTSTFLTATALGGGGGSGTDSGGNGTPVPGKSGGSGGGGPHQNAGGSGTAGQGNAGGAGGAAAGYFGGGGGGAGSVGGDASADGTTAGAGGAGLPSSITGSVVYYAGGGGAGGTGGTGGAGGGGAGARTGSGTAGTAYTGGGGGGGGNVGTAGAGGSGVVIINLPNTVSGIVTGNPIVTTTGSNVIYTFTASGSISVVPLFVPTAALTATTATVLLTGLSDRIVDVSTFSNTLTVVSGAKAVDINPYGYTTGALTTNIGSGYFDGTGDYLTVTTATSNIIITADFTIDMWIYPTNVTGTFNLVAVGTEAAARYVVYIVNGVLTTNIYGSAAVSMGGTIPINAWTQVSIIRSGSTIRGYLNGVVLATTDANAATLGNGSQVRIGSDASGAAVFVGYMSNVRIIRGQALYTTNFVVPTLPSTATTSTQLLTLQTSVPVNNKTAFDYGPFKHQLTFAGAPAQGTFTPYGSNWSVYFGASGNYLTGSNAGFNISATTATWTLECWIYPVGAGTFFAIGNGGAYGNAFSAAWGSTTNKFTFGGGNGSAGVYSATSGGTYYSTQWYHVAVSRTSAGVYTMFINGVADATVTYNAGALTAGTTFVINGLYDNNGLGNGGGASYISNLRFISGTALYTSTFTPPKAPSNLATNTILLTCATNRYIDISGVTTTTSLVTGGTPSVQRFAPYANQGYNKGVIGGSTYFSSGDYFTLPVNPAFDLGLNACCVEAWIYPTQTSGMYIFATSNNVSGQTRPNFIVSTTSFQIDYFGNAFFTGSITIRQYTWNHVAFTRAASSGAWRFFLNGVLSGYNATGTQNLLQTATAQTINALSGGSTVAGYMSDFRITNGSVPTAYQTAVTTTGTPVFTPTPAPLRAETNTVLLLNMTDAVVTDSTMQGNVITSTNARTVTTTFKKYNSSLMYLDGASGTALSVPASTALNLSSGDFTIEGWIYHTSTPSGVVIEKDGAYAVAFPQYEISFGAGKLYFVAGQGNQANTAATTYISTNAVAALTWNHFAVIRSGTTIKIFLNGNLELSTAQGQPMVDGGRPLLFGVTTGNPYTYNSFYLDDFRITKGLARYITAFTPPTTPPKLR